MARTYTLHINGVAKTAVLGEVLGGGKLWKWEDGVAKVFTVSAPIRKGTPLRRSGIATAPDLLDVVDVETGNKETILAGKVLVSNLTENYPDEGYVGRTFHCVQGPPPVGKRYKTMEVREVSVTDEPAAQDEAPKPKTKAKK